MAAGRTRKEVVSILEARFDYQSARSILVDALKLAGVESKDSFDDAELTALAGALAQLATATEGVAERLAAAPEPEPPAAKAPAPEPPPAAEEPAESAADAPKKDDGKKKKK